MGINSLRLKGRNDKALGGMFGGSVDSLLQLFAVVKVLIQFGSCVLLTSSLFSHIIHHKKELHTKSQVLDHWRHFTMTLSSNDVVRN